MNNSRIAIEQDVESKETMLVQRQGELTRIVEAIRRIADSEDWKVLKELVFDGVLKTLERQLKDEAQKATVVTAELYRLQGQLVWARKYADLDKLAEFFKMQIESIKNNIKHEQKTPRDGAL